MATQGGRAHRRKGEQMVEQSDDLTQWEDADAVIEVKRFDLIKVNQVIDIWLMTFRMTDQHCKQSCLVHVFMDSSCRDGNLEAVRDRFSNNIHGY